MGSIFAIGTGYAARMRGWLRSRPLRRVMLAGAFAPLLVSAQAPAELTLEVHGLRNANGLVRLCLTSDPHHFRSPEQGRLGTAERQPFRLTARRRQRPDHARRLRPPACRPQEQERLAVA